MASSPVSAEQAGDLRERTDGNPFFLVEYARLAGERADLADLLKAHPPTAVAEVLTRRLARLPEQTVAALRVAAVIGRQFDTPTLAAAARVDEDDLLDVVEPAQAAGLVREDGADRFLFAHALVRDTLRASMSASRKARVHVRVAETLEGAPGRETEVALHWLEGGPAYAAQAWRSAAAAAEVAKGLHAYDQVAELLTRALDTLARDPTATPRERYDLLMSLVDAYRWSALLPELVRCVEQAIAVAEELGDPEAVARAAMAATQGGLWRSAPPGRVNELVVGALRTSLERLPGGDGDLRCRSMLALANELDFTSSFAELRALVDEALAMADRLGAPRLRLDAYQAAFVSVWVPATAEERLDLARRATGLAREVGEHRSFVVAATLLTVVLGELGRRSEMLEAAEVARSAARRMRIAYGEMVLDSAELPWQAMSGRFDVCRLLLDRVRDVAGRISHDFADEAVAGASIALALWGEEPLDALPILEEMNGELYPFAATITVHLLRAGDVDRARAWHAAHGAPLEAPDAMMTLLMWAHASEVALCLHDADLGGAVYALLAPYAGRSCSAGSSLASGPVDAYLAMAAAATGEREIAGRHADDALGLATDWGLEHFADWLRAQRAAYAY